MEMAVIAKRPKVELERLQFDTKLIRDVGNFDVSEVRLPSHWAYTGKLWAEKFDNIIPLRLGVGKGLKGRRRTARHQN